MTDLRPGTSSFNWLVGKEFFETFGNAEILGARLEVEAIVHWSGLKADIECRFSGSVTVTCDRCLEEVTLPTEGSFKESFSPESGELDFSQEVYDYVCTSLPLQRLHPDGECNEETTKFLSI